MREKHTSSVQPLSTFATIDSEPRNKAKLQETENEPDKHFW